VFRTNKTLSQEAVENGILDLAIQEIALAEAAFALEAG